MSNARNIAALSTVEVGATADQTKADLNAIGVSGGRKNLIMNGGFDVWQRGTSFTSGDAYRSDRCFSFTGSRGDTSFSRSTDVPTGEGFKYSAVITATQGHGLPFYRSQIEDFATVVPTTKAHTVSFWAKASVSMSINSDLGDAGSKIHTLTTTWQRFINVVPAGTGFSYIALDLENNTVAGTIYITGVQLELGSVATDFEHRSYGEELALCQRFYWQGGLSDGRGVRYKYATAGSNRSAGHVTFPSTMRIAPTMTIVTTPNYDSCSHNSFGYTTADGFSEAVTVVGTSMYRAYWGVYAADAEL